MTERGDCYESAAMTVIDRGLQDYSDEWILVHATVNGQGPLEGRWIGHGWAENRTTGFALDCSNGRFMARPIADYRQAAQAKNVREYTAEQAARLLLQHENYGPWEEVDGEELYTAPQANVSDEG